MATATYESVLEQVRQLPREDRRRLRDAIDDDMDTHWDATFAESQDQLAKLAAKARAYIAAGRRIPFKAFKTVSKDLRTQIPRHGLLANGYAREAVSLIDELNQSKLSEEQR